VVDVVEPLGASLRHVKDQVHRGTIEDVLAKCWPARPYSLDGSAPRRVVAGLAHKLGLAIGSAHAGGENVDGGGLQILGAVELADCFGNHLRTLAGGDK